MPIHVRRPIRIKKAGSRYELWRGPKRCLLFRTRRDLIQYLIEKFSGIGERAVADYERQPPTMWLSTPPVTLSSIITPVEIR